MRSLLLPSLLLSCSLLSFAAEAKVRVVATTASLAALTREVGGADVEVDALAASSEDPHFVDAKPSLILKLNRADLLIENGLELEIGWLPRLQLQARNPKVAPGGAAVFDASTMVDKLEIPASTDRSQGDVHAGGNPHYLYDPARAAKVALGIGERLAALDPSAAPRLRERAARIAATLEQLARDGKAAIAKLPAERRRVIAYHRSLTYLEQSLGLEEVATVEPKPGVPPDPAHVAAVLKTIKQQGARVILQEEYYPRSTPKTLAQLSGARLVVLEGGPRVGGSEAYTAWAARTIEEVLRALTA